LTGPPTGGAGVRVTFPPRPAPDPAHTRVVREFKHASPLIGCRFDPSGRFLFVSALDSTIQRYDLLTGAKAPLAGHKSWVRGMAFVPPAGDDGRDAVRAWMFALTGGWGTVAAPPKPAPFTLISGDYHGKLLWWPGDADAPRPVREVEAH